MTYTERKLFSANQPRVVWCTFFGLWWLTYNAILSSNLWYPKWTSQLLSLLLITEFVSRMSSVFCQPAFLRPLTCCNSLLQNEGLRQQLNPKFSEILFPDQFCLHSLKCCRGEQVSFVRGVGWGENILNHVFLTYKWELECICTTAFSNTF